MIGVVVPAHDEAASIAQCLAAIGLAAACPALRGEPVRVFVADDRCSDRTAEIALACGATVVVADGGNVGSARAAGMRAAIATGADWLASTDADSIVPGDWLSAQRRSGADAFCGMVAVVDWLDFAPDVQHAHARAHALRDGHPHVHGANLGVATAAYLGCGGFRPLSAHEDVALVRDLEAIGARIARPAAPVVLTSARRSARAQGGFADYLLTLEARLRAVASAPSAIDGVNGVAHGA
ncbi:glycosyltransferase [Luteimonas sp. WGS1318]|uniref:glycosyltransferase n=1 Tax=Luteimonas sp. WGS1318 TaxID=3366815 RepID=UPI00372D5EF4